MPKLTTSVENIQLTTNMVDADTPSKEWRDDQYPSARSLYSAFDKIHPVGCVLCLTENTNPAELYNHGTWELIDKEFAYYFRDLANADTDGIKSWTPDTATASSPLSSGLIAGHSVTLRLALKVTSDGLNYIQGLENTTDTGFTLGVVNPATFGLTLLPMKYNGIPFVIDDGSLVGIASISQEGTVTVTDCWSPDGTNTIKADAAINLNLSYTTQLEYMIDSFCNKFYFKRVA
jgi:hypothetical protein